MATWAVDENMYKISSPIDHQLTLVFPISKSVCDKFKVLDVKVRQELIV